MGAGLAGEKGKWETTRRCRHGSLHCCVVQGSVRSEKPKPQQKKSVWPVRLLPGLAGLKASEAGTECEGELAAIELRTDTDIFSSVSQ